MWKKFKEFAFKGNILDMAVGVIIGGAFGKIVSSLVNDIIMPLIGLLMGGKSFADLKYVITAADEANGVAEAAITYGNFIQTFVDFLIIALSMFFFVTAIAKASELRHKKEREAAEEAARLEAEKKAAEPTPPTQEELLTEIRDLLKNK